MSTTARGIAAPLADWEPVRPSATLAAWGLVLTLLAAPIVSGIAAFNLFYVGGGSQPSLQFNGGAALLLVLAGLLGLVGFIMLMVAVIRALSTIDRVGARLLSTWPVQ